jgi:hypothetical protein
MGGAIFNQAFMSVVNSTLSGNSAVGGTGFRGGAGLGGGIFNLSGVVQISSSTVAGNSALADSAADERGGAVYDLGYDAVAHSPAFPEGTTLTNSVLADSLPSGVADVVVDQPATVSGGLTNHATATVTFAGPNLVETQSALGGGVFNGPAPITSDPQLSPLANNGGPGMLTMRPANTSPAVNAGDAATCPQFDERHYPRQRSSCDLGALDLVPVSRPAIVRSSTSWLLHPNLGAGGSDVTFSLGVRPLVPVLGDWDGNGSKTPGIYKDGAFQLYNTQNASDPPTAVSYGTDTRGFPVAGDFNGDGIDDLAVYSGNGNWQVRLSNGTTFSFTFGSGAWPATVAVAGDWDGDGTDGIGVYVAGTWSLRNTASAGAANLTPSFAPVASAYPVVGDWNGDGIDTIGVKSGSLATWALSDSNVAPTTAYSFAFGQPNTDLPLAWRILP